MALTNDARATFMAIVKGDASQAVTEFKRMGNSIEKSTRQAEGGVGKFQSITTQAMANIKANAGMMAVAAGAAVAAFAAKGVKDFMDLSKAALDFGKATGLSTEQASRWIAVGDDFGVTAEGLETSFGRLAKTLDGASWRKYGIATRDAGGNARSTNAILLDAFDVLSKTTNATERAKIAAELFGKGYATLAPLIGKTRGELEGMLGAVSETEVVTAAEAQRAEEMRLAFDSLGDSVKNLGMSLGELLTFLAPVINLTSEFVNAVTDGYKGLFGLDEQTIAGPIQEFINVADEAEGSIAYVGEAFRELQRDALNSRSTWDRAFGGGDTFEATRKAFEELATENRDAAEQALAYFDLLVTNTETGNGNLKEQADSLGLTRDRYNELVGLLDGSGSLWDRYTRDQEEAARDAEAAAKAAWDQYNAILAIANADLGVSGAVRNLQDAQDAFRTTTDDAKTTKNEVEEAGDRVKQALLGVAGAYMEQQKAAAEAAGAEYTAQQAAMDQAASLEYLRDTLAPGDPLRQYLQGYIDDLRSIPPEVATNITVRLGTSEFDRLQAMYAQRVPTRATGGGASGMTLVGENGPEIANLPQGTWVSNAAETQRLLRQASLPSSAPAARATTVNVTVNVPPTANPVETGRYVADALRSYYRNGGQPV
jgi:hypothetical protein